MDVQIVLFVSIILIIILYFILFKYFSHIGGIRATTKPYLLTFNGSPNQHTPKILDILKNHNIVAIFFITAEECKNNLDLIRDIIKLGHHIGILGNDETSVMLKGRNYVRDNYKKAIDTISKIVKDPIRYYRPVNGYQNIWGQLGAQDLGLYHLGWSLNTYNEHIDYIKKYYIKGSIILFHHNLQTVQVLNGVINFLNNKNHLSKIGSNI
jgi:peptidoglycan-N-acetylglucosamine deacetylase